MSAKVKIKTHQPTAAELEQFEKRMEHLVDEEYGKLLGHKHITNPRLKEWAIRNSPARPYGCSHRARFTDAWRTIKYSYTLSKYNTASACFKVTLKKTSCIYAFLHADCKDGAPVPKMVSTGPAFRSQDGEYRSRMIKWKQASAIYDNFADALEPLESYMVGAMDRGELQFQVDLCYPFDEGKGAWTDKARLKFEDFINERRLPVILYMFCWLTDYHKIFVKTMENHMHPAYQWIIYQEEQMPVYETLRRDLGAEKYDMIVEFISYYYTPEFIASCAAGEARPLAPNGVARMMPPQCGQKITPMSYIEANRPGDINYPIWNELFLVSMGTNLVMNLISPSFIMINGISYVQNSHAGIYDNMAVHIRYKQSSIADKITGQLTDADRRNYDDEGVPHNNKFFKLSGKIRDARKYANTDIKLTDIAICVTYEHGWRTIRDIPVTLGRDTLVNLQPVFTDARHFARHMFEYIYGFYCLNSKFKIIHGDLHTNNVTMMRLHHCEDSADQLPEVLYIMEHGAYLFPHSGAFSIIIDFSRACTADHELIRREFGDVCAEQYMLSQRAKLMALLATYMSGYMEKHEESMRRFISTNFDLAFKILSAVDTLTLMSNIEVLFSIDPAFKAKEGRVVIPRESMTLLQGLYKEAERLIRYYLTEALNGRIKSPDDIEYPNLTIIKKFFEANLVDPADTAKHNVVESFNCLNDLTYDIRYYDSWLPMLQISTEINMRRKMGFTVEPWMLDSFEVKKINETANDRLAPRYDTNSTNDIKEWMLM